MKGYALLVGVNKVDVKHYGTGKNLCCSLNDTNTLIKFLLSSKLYNKDNIRIKNAVNAKWDAVKSEIQDIQNLANNDPEGAYVFLYFSGHGASLMPIDKQFLCFYDRMVMEDEIQSQIQGFNENCKVFITLDACYSAGIINSPELKGYFTGLPGKNPRDFSETYDLFRDIYDPIYDAYEIYEFVPEAEINYLCAAAENKKTKVGPNCQSNSRFTGRFASYWSTADRNSNYQYFYDLFSSTPGSTVTPFIFNEKSDFFSTTYPLIFKKTNHGTTN